MAYYLEVSGQIELAFEAVVCKRAFIDSDNAVVQLECTAKSATVEAVVRNRGHALRNFKRAGKIEAARKSTFANSL